MFMSLVKDLEKFNNYPWGTYIYRKTIAALNVLFQHPGPTNKSGTAKIRGSL